MVFQKRLEYESNRCQIPAMPRVPKSAKGKRSARKKVEDNQMCAFDILATLAGKLLAEREGLSTPCKTAGVTSSVHANMKEALGDGSPLKGGGFDQVSCDVSTFSPFAPHGHTSHTSKLHLESPKSKSAAYAPLLEKSDASKKDASANEFIAYGAKAELPNKCFSEGYSTSPMVSCVCKVDDGTVVMQGERQRTGCLLCGDASRIQKKEDPMDLDTKPATLVSSDSSVEVPPYEPHRRGCSISFPSVRNGMRLHADRDDGENSSGCTYPRSVHSKPFKAHCTGLNRIRKMVKSNYRKADLASYDDGELSNDDSEIKAAFHKHKPFYTRQRTRRSSFKRRKMFERCSVSASRGSCGDEAVVDSQVKDGIRLEASDVLAALNGANNISCTTRSQNLSYESANYPVKLSIKSFRVPELFIEIPSNATVGSLKRTVMEAVMAILGDGLRVGVLLQGKKVRDDNKTLLQAGISHENKMGGLGFTLEPNPACSAPHHNIPEAPSCCLPCEPLLLKKKLQAAVPAAQGKGSSNATLWPPPIPMITNCTESDHDSAHSAPTVSKALIPMAALNSEALAIVPLGRFRRSEMVQRRIRRPFSVSEVEALVQAVEKIGTGRWRDVKLRAFDNSKHRTYVDLKDKWKTLVHTARISPQQRRGEPVPQELLDRVLLAHAYWCQQQPKAPCLLT